MYNYVYLVVMFSFVLLKKTFIFVLQLRCNLTGNFDHNINVNTMYQNTICGAYANKSAKCLDCDSIFFAIICHSIAFTTHLATLHNFAQHNLTSKIWSWQVLGKSALSCVFWGRRNWTPVQDICFRLHFVRLGHPSCRLSFSLRAVFAVSVLLPFGKSQATTCSSWISFSSSERKTALWWLRLTLCLSASVSLWSPRLRVFKKRKSLSPANLGPISRIWGHEIFRVTFFLLSCCSPRVCTIVHVGNLRFDKGRSVFLC